jgi:hypothetical protein
MIVATINKGATITVNNVSYTVIGSRSMRVKYFYIVRDSSGRKYSLKRNDLIEGQKTGSVKVIG